MMTVRHDHERETGLTVVELLILVLTLAILVAIVVPVYSQFVTAYRLSAAASLVAGELQAARMLAVAENNQYDLTINGVNFQITDPSDANNPPRTEKFLPPGVTFSQTPAQPIRFRSRGEANPSGTVVVSNDSGTITIAVEPAGTVRVTDNR
ncbi:MAG: GspH/FimT family pseudopilin [Acidobacteria bacterium]|nr:GspH/FimT family pseudopilin [Acidobacteriota bacterium]